MISTVQWRLFALQPELAAAWRAAFADVPAVKIIEGDILAASGDAIVSPANSFGYMDGGLDRLYSEHFGWEPEKRVRDVILRDHHGELPVGQAIVVETGHPQVRFLISAPTMRVPSDVSGTVNAYLAFRAVLRAVEAHNASAAAVVRAPMVTVLCPGLGTGEGRMPAARCATQMREAYRIVVEGEVVRLGGLAGAVRHHMMLIR
jgi:O-acetyl-ADP-ribose deacetylase (regulator of RNase III)